ncbi:hypothetical protein [Xanthomonas phaseoli]|uniref:hypothetical protein n=1 Tax=Xanthomonas phaseoli TaxID=1985254 RepID=UPI00036FB6FB|nr:hypothetical protein [Xanthomonas phaseoli]
MEQNKLCTKSGDVQPPSLSMALGFLSALADGVRDRRRREASDFPALSEGERRRLFVGIELGQAELHGFLSALQALGHLDEGQVGAWYQYAKGKRDQRPETTNG